MWRIFQSLPVGESMILWHKICNIILNESILKASLHLILTQSLGHTINVYGGMSGLDWIISDIFSSRKMGVYKLITLMKVLQRNRINRRYIYVSIGSIWVSYWISTYKYRRRFIMRNWLTVIMEAKSHDRSANHHLQTMQNWGPEMGPWWPSLSIHSSPPPSPNAIILWGPAGDSLLVSLHTAKIIHKWILGGKRNRRR